MVYLMKKCIKCLKILPKSIFYKNKTTKDGFQYTCKNCQRIYRVKNSVSEIERNKKKRKELREFINNIKKQHQCEMCGEKRWYCLDFHHKGKKKS